MKKRFTTRATAFALVMAMVLMQIPMVVHAQVNAKATLVTNAKKIVIISAQVEGMVNGSRVYDGNEVTIDKSKVSMNILGGGTPQGLAANDLTYTWKKFNNERNQYENIAQNIAPRNVGKYQLVVAIPASNETYQGNTIVQFEITRAELTVTPYNVTMNTIKVKVTPMGVGNTCYLHYTDLTMVADLEGTLKKSEIKNKTGVFTLTNLQKNKTYYIDALIMDETGTVNGIIKNGGRAKTLTDKAQVGTPVANLKEGIYESNKKVTLTSPTEDASIYYTTDGSNPTTASKKYQGPIEIKGTDGRIVTTTIKAIAVMDDKSQWNDSKVATFQYTIKLAKTPIKQQTNQTITNQKPNQASKLVTVVDLIKPIKSYKTSQKLSWSKMKNADGYYIYAAKCNTKKDKNELKKVKDITSNKTTSYTMKGRKKGTWYKYRVVAYQVVNGRKVAFAQSLDLHAITSGSKKYSNPVKVKVVKSSIKIKNKKTAKIKAKVIMPKGKKIKNHTPKIRYIVSNTSIVSVTKSGKIKAKKKGKCTIYAIAQNGVKKMIKVKVK